MPQPSTPPADHTQAALALAEFSATLDTSYPPDLCDEARDRRRFNKITEENGEVAEAYSGMVGENPRKGVTNGLDRVLHELLDVATAALGTYEYFTGNHGTALDALDEHIHTVTTRAKAALQAGPVPGHYPNGFPEPRRIEDLPFMSSQQPHDGA